jgi:polyisoprenoid-binding protein YceI
MKDLFFKVAKFPQATIKATIDMKKLKSIRYYKRMEIPAILEFYGVSKKIKLDVLIAKVYKKKLLKQKLILLRLQKPQVQQHIVFL